MSQQKQTADFAALSPNFIKANDAIWRRNSYALSLRRYKNELIWQFGQRQKEL